MLGHCTLKTWSSTQAIVALSSAEAELYSMSKAAAQAIGLMQTMEDFGEKMKTVVQSDSSAAVAIVSREGLGRTRHIRTEPPKFRDEVLALVDECA